MSGNRGLTAAKDADGIDEQGSDRQDAEQGCLREIDPKEGIQRVAAGADEADGDAHDQQHQGILITSLFSQNPFFQ